MSGRLDPLALQTVAAIAREGSPTLAAAALGVNITTVYRRIEALEAALGVVVFDRHRSGWRLIPGAEPLLAAGRELEGLLLRAAADVRTARTFAHGGLRIAVSEDIATHYLGGRLEAFCLAYPGVQPELIVSHAFADLDHGEADVAIRPHRAPGDALVGRKVGRMQHALYASTGYVGARGRPASLGELGQRPDLVPGRTPCRHRLCGFGAALESYTVAEWLDGAVDDAVIAGRFDSTAALTGAVLAGFGIGLLPCFVGSQAKGLVRVLEVPDGLPVDVWLVTTRAGRKRTKVAAFLKFFTAAIRRDAALFDGTLASVPAADGL